MRINPQDDRYFARAAAFAGAVSLVALFALDSFRSIEHACGIYVPLEGSRYDLNTPYGFQEQSEINTIWGNQSEIGELKEGREYCFDYYPSNIRPTFASMPQIQAPSQETRLASERDSSSSQIEMKVVDDFN